MLIGLPCSSVVLTCQPATVSLRFVSGCVGGGCNAMNLFPSSTLHAPTAVVPPYHGQRGTDEGGQGRLADQSARERRRLRAWRYVLFSRGLPVARQSSPQA